MEKSSSYFKNLAKEVIEKSDSNIWDSAVTEWEIIDVEEDMRQFESCICSKEKLRYLYTIKNRINENQLYPIGSQCIKKFGQEDLNNQINIKEQMFKLLHEVEENIFLTLSSEHFSRKLLLYLYEEGAFKPTKYNDYNPVNDYHFMLDMFNKRTRTENQNRKATAIILNSIKPFLQARIAEKVRL